MAKNNVFKFVADNDDKEKIRNNAHMAGYTKSAPYARMMLLNGNVLLKLYDNTTQILRILKKENNKEN